MQNISVRRAASFALALLALYPLAADTGIPFSALALPSSRSPSPVFNRYASLPPFTARLPRKGETVLAPSFEIAQAMLAALYLQEDGSDLPVANLDFETFGLELPISYGLSDRIAFELDAQAQYLWGGFLDEIIEGFHGLFGFPNGGREFFDPYDVAVFVETDNGYDLLADKAMFLVSDPYFGAAFGLIDSPALGLSFRLGGTVPLGLGRGFAGTELPQILAGAYADWRPSRRLSVYAMAGGILPLESFGWTNIRPAPMAQGRISSFIELNKSLFLFVDFNLKTSPISGNIYANGLDFFALPNADLLIGFAFASPGAKAAGKFSSFTVQEDPISHNSTDIRFIGSGVFTIE